jgi:hypothetical protein
MTAHILNSMQRFLSRYQGEAAACEPAPVVAETTGRPSPGKRKGS